MIEYMMKPQMFYVENILTFYESLPEENLQVIFYENIFGLLEEIFNSSN